MMDASEKTQQIATLRHQLSTAQTELDTMRAAYRTLEKDVGLLRDQLGDLLAAFPQGTIVEERRMIGYHPKKREQVRWWVLGQPVWRFGDLQYKATILKKTGEMGKARTELPQRLLVEGNTHTSTRYRVLTEEESAQARQPLSAVEVQADGSGTW